MKHLRRKFIKLIGASFLSTFLLPYKLLYSVTKKIINPDLSDEQKNIMLNEATERPYSSPLNHEKRNGFFHCANCGVHHGHVFADGLQKKRFCSNGLCLIFKPEN